MVAAGRDVRSAQNVGETIIRDVAEVQTGKIKNGIVKL